MAAEIFAVAFDCLMQRFCAAATEPFTSSDNCYTSLFRSDSRRRSIKIAQSRGLINEDFPHLALDPQHVAIPGSAGPSERRSGIRYTTPRGPCRIKR